MAPVKRGLLVVVSAGWLSGCGFLTGSDGAASIAGVVSCASGATVSQGSVGVYRGRPYGNCIVPCEPTSAPLLAEERLSSTGRFDLSISFDGGTAPRDLWILARAEGEACGSGYNFETRSLGQVEDGQRLELTLVITPFVT